MAAEKEDNGIYVWKLGTARANRVEVSGGFRQVCRKWMQVKWQPVPKFPALAADNPSPPPPTSWPRGFLSTTTRDWCVR